MVIIKGMERPKSCQECELEKYGVCIVGSRKHGNYDKQYSDCPLISVDDVIEQMEKRKLRFGFDVGDYDGDRDALNFNSGIDTCIAILRGVEETNEREKRSTP